jgi:hypothetical protein
MSMTNDPLTRSVVPMRSALMTTIVKERSQKMMVCVKPGRSFSDAYHIPDFGGEDEYSALLHFIDNAARMKHEDEDGDEDEDVEYKRVSST